MSRIDARKEIWAGQTLEKYKDSQPMDMYLKVMSLVKDYMDTHFLGFTWELGKIAAGNYDFNNHHNLIGATIYTNACDKTFRVLSFIYDVEANCFKETPDWDVIRDINNALITSNPYFIKENCKFARCYLAIYNETDRKDGNPSCVEIKSLTDHECADVLKTNHCFEAIFSKYSYEGDGCMEIRTVDFDGEEDVWVFKDNSGYRFLGDVEPVEEKVS